MYMTDSFAVAYNSYSRWPVDILSLGPLHINETKELN